LRRNRKPVVRSAVRKPAYDSPSRPWQ
jgi:hypothetical protein